MPTTFYEVQCRGDEEVPEMVRHIGTEEEMKALFNDFLDGTNTPPEEGMFPILKLIRVTQNDDGITGSVETLKEVDLREQEWWEMRFQSGPEKDPDDCGCNTPECCPDRCAACWASVEGEE